MQQDSAQLSGERNWQLLPSRALSSSVPAQGGWSQMRLVGNEEEPGLGYWQETQAPVAACGQLLPLLGDVSHSLGVGASGLFLEVGMRRVSWQQGCC